jgi:hypothetical protein
MAGKKRLFLLHTMPFVMDQISAPLEREFLAAHPDVEIQTMLDTSLLADTMAAGRVTPRIAARLLSTWREAEQAGAACCCSPVPRWARAWRTCGT